MTRASRCVRAFTYALSACTLPTSALHVAAFCHRYRAATAAQIRCGVSGKLWPHLDRGYELPASVRLQRHCLLCERHHPARGVVQPALRLSSALTPKTTTARTTTTPTTKTTMHQHRDRDHYHDQNERRSGTRKKLLFKRIECSQMFLRCCRKYCNRLRRVR